ncbi:MAG: cytochrome c peroxidase, partial [bacterium]
LESQALGPIVSTVEMGHLNRDWPSVTARLITATPLALSPIVPNDLKTWINGRGYPALFQEAFGSTAINPARMAFAIAAYERTLLSNQARIDSMIAGTVVLTPQQAQGQQLFGQLGCAGCHAGSLFSDNNFHYVGVRPATEDSGRFVVTRNLANLGQFKTPSLRNVGLRATYFHNGRFNRLEDVVAFYNRGGDFNAPNKPAVIRPLNLTPQQQAALVAFLRGALTDPRVRDQVFPFDRPSLFSDGELVPVVTGAGVAGSGGVTPQVIAIEPPLSGNTSFTVGLQRGLGGATATLVIDSSEPPASAVVPSSAALTVQSITLQGSGSGNGFASVPVAIPVDPTLRGRTFHGRWYVADPAAADGVSWTPAFSFRVFGANADGLLAVDPSPTVPRVLRLSPGRPTPFRASTVIAYEVFAAERVDLVVYDAMGRTVRTLVNDAVQLPGAYTITWDGRDDAGRAAPSGVYFYRLRSGAEANTMRTVKLD